MKELTEKQAKKTLYATLVGTFLVALGCFTPLLVAAVGLLGLSVIIPYLDYFLFPALALFIILSYLAYNKYKKYGPCKIQEEKEDNESEDKQ